MRRQPLGEGPRRPDPVEALELGAAAGRMLMELLRKPEEVPAPLLLRPELIVRASTLRNKDKADRD